MSIHQKLNDELKEAMKTSNESVKNYTRGLKAKVSEYCVANKIDRTKLADDNVLIIVITAHKKSLEKAIELFGDDEKAKNLIEEYKNEIQFCDKFLPNQNDVAEDVSKVVGLVITYLNVNDIKQLGKVIGFVMKHFKDNNKVVDGALVKKLATDELIKRGINGS
ncbi:MAG: GatB/YqeY domain-containing protein [Patescibacteria group bacterium]|jgi:uncharacterized protein YqeY